MYTTVPYRWKLNVFDLQKLNSFYPNRTYPKPLVHQLQPQSYRKYIAVFQRLLAYVYRRFWLREGPSLHQSTPQDQWHALEYLIQAAGVLDSMSQGDLLDMAYAEQCQKKLDNRCLIFCITLLDHPLYGDIYDSHMIGFLAAFAIELPGTGGGLRQHGKRPKGKANTIEVLRLTKPLNYTPHLSALVKMAQLLIGARALLAVEEDEATHPAEALEAMQQRFFYEGTRSPMCWIRKMRVYAKKIQDTTASLGIMNWSDNGETLIYADTILSMSVLKSFVKDRLQEAHNQLSDLLLIHEDDKYESVVPLITLRRLVDNPGMNEAGWNFIQHPQKTSLHGYEAWLLNRVLDNDQLRKVFFYAHKASA